MSNANAFCYGSSAVKLDRPSLVLIEGGANVRDEPRDAKPVPGRAPLAAVFAGALVVLVLLAFGTLSQALASSQVASRLGAAPVATHVVRDGETVWSIAGECDFSDVSTKDVANWIEERNGLGDGMIYAGQRLDVPQGAASLE